MIVAIGSTRGPKVEAVRHALSILKERFPGFFRDELRLIARTVPSGDCIYSPFKRLSSWKALKHAPKDSTRFSPKRELSPSWLSGSKEDCEVNILRASRSRWSR